MKAFFLVALIFALFSSPALAQEAATLEDSLSEITTDSNSVVDLSFEGLDDADLTVDLEAEALPTTNRFAYRWERFRDNVINVFTFNAEKKARHYQQRLHRLDRKLTACSEIGDSECINKIEERMQTLSDRTEKYIAKREELKEQFLTRFQNWRDNRESLIQDRKEKAGQLRDRMQELRQQRKSNYKEAHQRRQERRLQTKDKIQQRRDQRKDNIRDRRDQRQGNIKDRRDQRQLNSKQRQQNREQLIEMRSKNVKQKLDQTREQVRLRQQNLDKLEDQ